MPDMFQLVQNYRTHNGIVRLAHSVVLALQHFFPTSIDKLQPESSKLAGGVGKMVEMSQLRGLIGVIKQWLQNACRSG